MGRCKREINLLCEFFLLEAGDILPKFNKGLAPSFNAARGSKAACHSVGDCIPH